jgi:hypothetical protein
MSAGNREIIGERPCGVLDGESWHVLCSNVIEASDASTLSDDC